MKFLTRVAAFIGKEIIEVLRRPGAIASLLFGPFVIMGFFGFGYVGRAPLTAIVVVPAASQLPHDAGFYERLGGNGIEITEVTPDAEGARTELRRHVVDLVAIAPPDAEQRFNAGQQSVIEVDFDTLDPVQTTLAESLAGQLSSAVNRSIIEQAVRLGQQQAAGIAPKTVPPEIVAAPTRAEARNLAPTQPGLITYYGPAVLALILQHMAMTLTALSLVRERLSGVVEIFRVAPVRASEILVGKMLALGLLSAFVAALILGLLVAVFNVSFLGDGRLLAAGLGLLIFASLAVGLLISVVSDSERQAVQLVMLALLASVFFSGFILELNQFSPIVQAASNLVPVTHGIKMAQELLLRGTLEEPWRYAVLAGEGAGVSILSWLVLRRNLATSRK